MLRVAQVPPHDIDEGGVAFSGPDRSQVPDQPDRGSDDPQPQAEADRSGMQALPLTIAT